MRHKAIKLTGLLALAFGVMAIGAGAAQAEPTSAWLIETGLGTNTYAAISGELLPEVQVVELEGNHGILLTTVGAFNQSLEILCTGVSFVDALLHKEGRSSVKALLFSGCKTLLEEEYLEACDPTTAGSEPGHITTKPLVDLLVLHKLGEETTSVDEVTPKEGETFVEFNYSEDCALESTAITGKGVLKDCEGALLTNKVVHLFSEGPLAELKYGSHAATIDGSVTVQLDGAHKGLRWSGHAG